MNNTNQLPPRASFASALAQKPIVPVAAPAVVPTTPAPTVAPVSVQTPGSPIKRPSAFPNNVQTSPVVKLPNIQATGSTADNSTQDTSAPVSLKAPIKFGSFAAAAAGLVETKPVSKNITSSSLPPRTHSAPPVVVEPVVIINAPAATSSLPKESEASEQVVVLVAPVNPELSVVLPIIQEDSNQQQQQLQQPMNYAPQHQPQHQQHYQQQQNFYYQNAPQQHHQQHYAPRPYYNQGGYNNNRAPQQHYHQQQQQSEGGYRPQQQYRPRPHYNQNQNRFYPSQQHGNNNSNNYYAPHPQHHTGYYQQQQQNQHFQQPAPAMNTFVGPAVPPTIPSNMPAFTSNPSEAAPSSASVVVPTVSVVKPVASKIKIVDPNTGKELNFGGSKVVEESDKAVEIKEAPTVAAPAAPAVAVPVAVTIPAAASASVNVTTPVAPSTPAKKISIVIKDPTSNQELDLNQVISRPLVDLAVEELTAAFCQSTKLVEDVEEDNDKTTNNNISAAPSPAPFEHNKEILANLHVEDDDFNSDDDEEDEEDYSDFSDEEEEEICIFIPSTIQFNQSISYAEGLISFTPPVDASGVWLYSRDFMLQFREKCTTTPGDLQERLSAAVEKAQAFAKSDRMNAADRPHRRKDSGRGGRDRRDRDGGDDRRKRSGPGHPGPGLLGPQAHLLDPNAVLKNRADNAWTPVKSAEDLSQTDRILREVKGLLNKLTLEKFHVISDKIISIGIMSSNVLSGVIDCVFDKSVDEPRFAPMYAELCYKIVAEEINGLKKENPANANPDSQFRRLLVERCQAEYKHKRAWSKKRLEKLLETTDSTAEKEVAAASPTVEESPEAAEAVKVVGELTDEDYMLIKLKRRVLGNMRFIGEIFKVGLIGEKIMHSIITELLSNVENPEEEEIECLCRLLTTVGSILDKPEAANFWGQYLGRMNWLTAQPGKLSSRVKFMVLDVLELRDKKWKTGKADEGPKTISQIQKEQEKKELDQQNRDRDHHRNRDHQQRDHRDQHRDHRDQQRDRQRPSAPPAAPAVKFTSKSSKNEEWNRSGPSKSGQLSRGPSFSAASSNSNNNNNSRRPTTPQPQNPEVVIGRFGVLGEEHEEKESVPAVKVEEEESAVVFADESEIVKKVVSLLDELVQMNNYDDVLDELKQIRAPSARASALSGLLNRAIEGGKKPSLLATIRVFTESLAKEIVDQKVIFEALTLSFGMIDDLAVDVPAVFEIAGQLYSALQITFSHILETLSACSDDSAKAKVAIHTINSTASESESEYRKQLSQDAKDFIEKNSTVSVKSLISRLQLQI